VDADAGEDTGGIDRNQSGEAYELTGWIELHPAQDAESCEDLIQYHLCCRNVFSRQWPEPWGEKQGTKCSGMCSCCSCVAGGRGPSTRWQRDACVLWYMRAGAAAQLAQPLQQLQLASACGEDISQLVRRLLGETATKEVATERNNVERSLFDLMGDSCSSTDASDSDNAPDCSPDGSPINEATDLAELPDYLFDGLILTMDGHQFCESDDDHPVGAIGEQGIASLAHQPDDSNGPKMGWK